MIKLVITHFTGYGTPEVVTASGKADEPQPRPARPALRLIKGDLAS